MTGPVSTSVRTAAGVRASSSWNLAGFGAEGSHDASGGTVGGQVGYRWQAGTFVFGLEAQGNWADFSGSNTSLQFPAFRNHTNVDAFGLFTGQVGYAINNVLLYVKGGAAVTSNSYRVNNVVGGGLAGVTGDDTRWGGTIGAGLEYAFAPNWSVGVEYNHLFMQDRTYNFTTPGGACLRHRPHQSGRRSRHRPPELQVRWPGCLALLRSFATLANHRSPGRCPGLFRWVEDDRIIGNDRKRASRMALGAASLWA